MGEPDLPVAPGGIRAGWLWWLQVAALLLAWSWLCGLHWRNDGLWYPDAARHAANGLFWHDFLRLPSLDPHGYAMSYYARYPVIGPTTYPPVFYLLEAGAFAVLGPSPYVGKGLVLVLALMLGLYTMAWARRWIGPGAGWAGALVLLLPGVFLWSQGVMLNVPALALSTAALYHARRWLESPPQQVAWKHLYLSAALGVLAVLTYLLSIVLVLVAAVWLLLLRRWGLLGRWRTWAALAAAAVPLGLWAIIILMYERSRLDWMVSSGSAALHVHRWHWRFYLNALPSLVGRTVLALAVAGLVCGLLIRSRRREAAILLSWGLVCLAYYAYVPMREGRYLLSICPVAACLAALAVQSAAEFLAALGRRRAWAAAVSLVLGLGVSGTLAALAARISVPSVNLVGTVAQYVREVAPAQTVLYEGRKFGVFIFHVRANDPGFRSRVVPGCKLLYVDSWWDRVKNLASSPDAVVRLLRDRGGCRWLVVEDPDAALAPQAARYLQEALKGPDFELVRSFPAERPVPRLSVYRLRGPVDPVQVVDMPFLMDDGEHVLWQHLKPITR